MIYDVKTRKIVSALPDRCVVGFISWNRLVKALRESGEFNGLEECISLNISPAGVEYYVTRKAR